MVQISSFKIERVAFKLADLAAQKVKNLKILSANSRGKHVQPVCSEEKSVLVDRGTCSQPKTKPLPSTVNPAKVAQTALKEAEPEASVTVFRFR